MFTRYTPCKVVEGQDSDNAFIRAKNIIPRNVTLHEAKYLKHVKCVIGAVWGNNTVSPMSSRRHFMVLLPHHLCLSRFIYTFQNKIYTPP